jgi:molybdenum ABC transporter molybdate-binding protein
VRGVGDVGSAVAVILHRAGYSVALHDEPATPTPRRGMAFADAIFDGFATLDGLTAIRVQTQAELRHALNAGDVIPVTSLPFVRTTGSTNWSALIDARMRKRAIPEPQCGVAPLVIGLGPNFVAGQNVDVAIETMWGDRLGEIIETGSTMALAGEPRPIGGVARERFVYAPDAGRFITSARIGDRVEEGAVVATIGEVSLRAPISGVLRGLTRSGVNVTARTKVIEVDPRGDPAGVFGVGERPRRIAEGVLRALIGARLKLEPAISRRHVAALLAGGAVSIFGLDARVAEPVETGVPVVAAAADLNYALPEISGQFTKDTGKTVKLPFGSSGNFATQIQQGAPFDIFFSADEEYVQKLAAAGLTVDDGTLYAVGRIGIFVATGSPLAVDGELVGLKAALADGRVKKFAIANPEHAPYGRAARAALQHAGLWDQIEPLLVLGENVSQATQFATTGGAQGGIIPLSLARAPEIAKLGTFALVPESWHPQLRQRMVLLKRAGETARTFYAYMQQSTARAALKRYGFVLPGEES